MKYAFMTFACPELPLDESLALARRYGYDGIEPRTACGHKHGVELVADAAQRRDIRKKAEETGIALCCIATGCQYSNPAGAAQAAEETRAYVDLAADVGSRRLRVFGGVIPDGLDRAESAESIVESLKFVADHAEKRGVIVCIETHDNWCDPEHMAEIMRRVDHPAIAVNWDIMHPVRQTNATMESAFQTLKPWIKHVHFHDGINDANALKFVPIGEGMVDHKSAVTLLRAMPYNDFLSGEWIEWKPYDEFLGSELATMKSYET